LSIWSNPSPSARILPIGQLEVRLAVVTDLEYSTVGRRYFRQVLDIGMGKEVLTGLFSRGSKEMGECCLGQEAYQGLGST
jgi:hypothetical protein